MKTYTRGVGPHQINLMITGLTPFDILIWALVVIYWLF